MPLSDFALGKSSISNREGIDPRLIAISDLAIKLTIIDFGHSRMSGLRTAEQQKELWRDGLSQCDGVNVISKHQLGKALDFFAYRDGKASWKESDLSLVAAAFLQAASMLGYKIRWGGLWKGFPDYPHIELIN